MKYEAEVFTICLTRRGRLVWRKQFKTYFWARVATKLRAMVADYLDGIPSEIGIAWKITKIEEES